jgi:glycosyltransferase involved in cell wall biosynthesis
MVSIAPMGVSTTRRPRNVLSHPDRPPAIAILGEARDMPAYSALLGGLSVVLKEHPALEVFIELRGPHEHDIWRQAERQALFGSISAIGSATQHRPLLMRCDVLLWPEHHGGLRSLLLEAMAAAIPVIASHDAALDMLRDGETARLVHRDDAEAWAEHLAGLLREPEQARALGRGGREHVVSHHQSSKQVLALLETLERVSGRAYAFPTGGARL